MSTDGESVFMTALGGRLYKLDAATGRIEWVMGTGVSDEPVDGERVYLSEALPDGDRLYMAGAAGFWALRK